MIHPNHAVKPHRARLVLPWGTRWEARVTNVLQVFLVVQISMSVVEDYNVL